MAIVHAIDCTSEQSLSLVVSPYLGKYISKYTGVNRSLAHWTIWLGCGPPAKSKIMGSAELHQSDRTFADGNGYLGPACAALRFASVHKGQT